jgi:hypothetical protein
MKQLNNNKGATLRISYIERSIHLQFQKQILQSEKIIMREESSRVYLQDMETPSYYNYYSFTSATGILYRNKVYATTLGTIGSGAKNQYADNLTSFSLSLIDEKKIRLAYTVDIDGESISRNYLIEHGKVVELR